MYHELKKEANMKPGTETIIDGVRMYVNGSRQWVADQWDKMFLPAVKFEKKGRYFKGENPNKQTELFYDRRKTKS